MFDIVLGKDNDTSISTEKVSLKKKPENQHPTFVGEMQTVFWRKNIRHDQQKRWKKAFF